MRHGSRTIGGRVFAALLIVIGALLALGGGQLAWLGGTLYYLFAGLLTALSGILLWRGSRAAPWCYAAMLVGTIGWAIFESGSDWWALVPRIIPPMVLGLGFFLVRGVWSAGPKAKALLAGATILAVAIGTTSHEMSDKSLDPASRNGIQARPTNQAAFPSATLPGKDWTSYGGEQGSIRHSSLTQITPQNVGRLVHAWSYRVGSTPAGLGAEAMLEVTPLKIGDTLYLCTGYNDVIALDANTGKQKWRYAARVDISDAPLANCRGVAYFKAAVEDCPERILTNTVGAELVALDARTGKPCRSFGRNGRVSLLTGMGDVQGGYYYVTSAPTLGRGKVVLGGWVYDNQYWGEPSGVIRAFDAATGALAWAWDMGRPGQKGLPPAGEAYTRSTPNSWAPMSADESLGLVYVPLGNPTPDHFGRQRRPFDEKFGSSVVALDAENGDVRWSFQTTHHDLWDYDVASSPSLVDLPGPNGVRKALVQPTKRGEVFLLDRETGEPLADVREVAVPQRGHVPEERLAPTQPVPVGMPGLGGPPIRESMMWGLTPLDQLWCRIAFRQIRYDGPYTPPGLTKSLLYPGRSGGSNWGGVSIDSGRGIMIANTTRFPVTIKLIPRQEANRLGIEPADQSAPLKGDSHFYTIAQAGTPYAVEVLPFLSPIGVPCLQPPYGMISAVDLATRKLLWTRPFGTARSSGPWGLRSHLPLPMGVPQHGGAITTAGGVTFIGASQDGRFRAFSTETGRLLWEAALPAGGQAVPMTYEGRNGEQFVVIAAGGSRSLQTKLGDYIVAYKLSSKR